MEIKVEFKDPKDMRYNTYDDYRVEGNILIFEIARSGNVIWDRIMLIHAMVESLLAQNKEITCEEVDRWDFSHPDSDEPAEEPGCPYQDAHLIAKGIEMVLCGHLQIPWKEYDTTIAEGSR